MERAEFLQIWRQTVGSPQQRQLPIVSLYEDSYQTTEPELTAGIEKRRRETTGRQAALIGDTAQQAKLDLARLGYAERLYIQGIAVSAQHINALYVWADECSVSCHPKAQPHIATMVEQAATVLTRLPMAAFIQNIRGYGLG
jgi:hypothetical protein